MIQETSYFETQTNILRFEYWVDPDITLFWFIFFVNKYVYCLHNKPDKRQLVTSKVFFGSEKAGLLDHSYNKCALIAVTVERRYIFQLTKQMKISYVICQHHSSQLESWFGFKTSKNCQYLSIIDLQEI